MGLQLSLEGNLAALRRWAALAYLVAAAWVVLLVSAALGRIPIGMRELATGGVAAGQLLIDDVRWTAGPRLSRLVDTNLIPPEVRLLAARGSAGWQSLFGVVRARVVPQVRRWLETALARGLGAARMLEAQWIAHGQPFVGHIRAVASAQLRHFIDAALARAATGWPRLIAWGIAKARRIDAVVRGAALPRLPPLQLIVLLAVPLVAVALGATQLGSRLATLALNAVGLPDPARLGTSEAPYSTFIYDRTGTMLLYTLEEERREYASLSEVPTVLRQATIAIEDHSFWTNRGIDPAGIARAFLANQADSGVTQGGSTITQQLVKARLLDDEQSVARKLREAVTAVRVTFAYPKERILEMYLNQIYYGNRSYGVKTAAKTYFGVTELDQLTLGQAALLAGLPQRPSVYDPVLHPEAARARRAQVLAAMVGAGFIDETQAAAAAVEPIAVRATQTLLTWPHVVFRVRDQLAEVLGNGHAAYVSGYRVYTTIDPGLQAIAERIVHERVAALGSSNVHNAALIAMDPRFGHVLAYVGSANYASQDPRVRGEFDVAGLGARQTGSTFKLFTYLAALRKGYTPSTVLWDVSTNFSPQGLPEYRPQNASPTGSGAGPENGPITIRQALRESLNIPAVKLTSLVGIDEVIATARQLGVERQWDRERLGLSFGIGAGELTLRELAGAYQIVANSGIQIEPTLILRIDDRHGRVVRDWSGPPKGKQAISPELAWLMTDLLKDTTDPLTSSLFGSWTNIGRPAALKTGTTDELRDVLAVGYVPELLTAVWMGNSDSSPMNGISSAMGPGVVWRDFMKAANAHLKLPKTWYARPAGIVERVVCVRPGLTGGLGSGLLPGTLCPRGWRTSEKFIAGTEPKADDKRFFDRGCVHPAAERPEWRNDVVRWAAAGKNARLGMPLCGVTPRSVPPRVRR